jgi:predicted TPR repeat methyltransferase
MLETKAQWQCLSLWKNCRMTKNIETSRKLKLADAVELATETLRNGHIAEAEMLYGLILQAAPDYPPALHGLGDVFSSKGDVARAAEYYCRATTADPKHAISKALLGLSYASLGRLEDAAQVYSEWLLEEPDNPTAAHLYAASSGMNIPERASDRYIKKTFDDFAADFDEQLLGRLAYQVPDLLEQELAKILQPEKKLLTLDAGCGTGLCGPVLAPYSYQLTGVDLSPKMLLAAQRREIYDELVTAELTGFLATQPAVFDLIVLADTLIYFGTLAPVFSAAHSALRVDGLLVFTAETSSQHPADDYQLHFSGRYSHNEAYITSTLECCGFSVISTSSIVIRQELGKPVGGILVIANKGAVPS